MGKIFFISHQPLTKFSIAFNYKGKKPQAVLVTLPLIEFTDSFIPITVVVTVLK